MKLLKWSQKLRKQLWECYLKEVSTFFTINTATNGRAAFMLKKGAKLKTKRQAHKKHNTYLKMLCRDNEERIKGRNQNADMLDESSNGEEEKEM